MILSKYASNTMQTGDDDLLDAAVEEDGDVGEEVIGRPSNNLPKGSEEEGTMQVCNRT